MPFSNLQTVHFVLIYQFVLGFLRVLLELHIESLIVAFPHAKQFSGIH